MHEEARDKEEQVGVCHFVDQAVEFNAHVQRKVKWQNTYRIFFSLAQKNKSSVAKEEEEQAGGDRLLRGGSTIEVVLVPRASDARVAVHRF